MKNIYILIALTTIFLTDAHAENVRVYTDYNPVRIAADSDNEAGKSGLSGNYKVIDRSEIPKDRSDRNAWKMSSGALVVDKASKEKIESKKTSKESAISKLKAVGLTDEELSALKIGG